MLDRFPNLYDRDRWRRYGYPMLALGVVCVVIGAIYNGRKDAGAVNFWLVAAALGFGLSVSLWMRQRYSYLRLEGDQLFFRYLTVSARVDLTEVRRARVAKLVAALQRRGRAPRSLSGADALVLRLRSPDSGRLRRLLSRRCVFGDELVIPLRDAVLLQRQIEAALAPQRRGSGDEDRPPAPRRRNRRR
ncbi:MAG: hypothetical protein ABR977_08800 [Candidatus Dormibacteria bacterium]|jgi:hypothetical protein